MTIQEYEPSVELDHYHRVQFFDARLDAMNDMFEMFLDGEGAPLIGSYDHLYQHIQAHYPESSWRRIWKGIVLATVAHQYNERVTKDGQPDRYRRFDGTPYIGHPLAMSIAAAGAEVETREHIYYDESGHAHTESVIEYLDEAQMREEIVIASAVHDVKEDTLLTLRDTDDTPYVIEGDEWHRIIRDEFNDPQDEDIYGRGNLISDIIEGVSEYEEIPDDLVHGIRDSAFYGFIREALMEKNSTMSEDEFMQRYDQNILDAIASVYKAVNHPLEHAENETQYWDMITGIIAVKSLDTHHNLKTPGTKDPKLLRARLLALISRLGGMGVSDRIMTELAQVIDVNESLRPFMVNPDNMEVIDDITLNGDQYKRAAESIMSSQFFVDPEQITVGVPITLADEHREYEGSRNSSVDLPFRPQVTCRLGADQMQYFDALACDPAFSYVNVDTPELRNMAGSHKPLMMMEVRGVWHEMQTMFGADVRMHSVMDEFGEVQFYTKTLGPQLSLADYMGDPSIDIQSIPAHKFFKPVFSDGDPQSRMHFLLTSIGMWYDPYTLLASQSYVAIWDGGYVVCDPHKPLRHVVDELGLGERPLKAHKFSGYADVQDPPIDDFDTPMMEFVQGCHAREELPVVTLR